MSALRPLPAVPSLEFERKEAKALLRKLRTADPAALERIRAHHPRLDASASPRLRLADAQFVVAREYGFASWPKLARYFSGLERQLSSPWRSVGHREVAFYEAAVRSMLEAHAHGKALTAQTLSAYVPRFYGLRVEDVLESEVSADDARLAVARRHGFVSWTALEAVASQGQRSTSREERPRRQARRAIQAADLAELQKVVEAHPKLLRPSRSDRSEEPLIRMALGQEKVQGEPRMRPIMDWLVGKGGDLQRELNLQLCGSMRMDREDVQRLLQRGADPNWIAPNGIPVLEHALLRYWNGAAVDVLAARAAPRKALWIAAGLGDVRGVEGFLDGSGRPTPAARRLRPDFEAVGAGGVPPSHPEPDDGEVLLEAFTVAMLNGRTVAMQYMASRGFNVNTLRWGTPLLHIAVGNAWPAQTETLLRCGADPELRSLSGAHSARETARLRVAGAPDHPGALAVAELLGLGVDAILAEHELKIASPSPSPHLDRALQLAADDAARLGQSEVDAENLLFGLLRAGGSGWQLYTDISGMDTDRLEQDYRDRLHFAQGSAERPTPPLSSGAEKVVQAAFAVARERRSTTVDGFHLLYALLRDAVGPAAELLERYGGNAEELKGRLDRPA